MRLLFVILFIVLNSCIHLYTINSDLYTMMEDKDSSSTSFNTTLRKDGFYRLFSNEEQNFIPTPFCFILFENGYFLDNGPPSTWALWGQGRRQWGKFRATGDSIKIQYFSYAMSNAGFFMANHTLTAQELLGYSAKDTLIFVTSIKYHEVDLADMNLLPIRETRFDPPLEYRFVRYSPLPSPDNWLMEAEWKKKKK